MIKGKKKQTDSSILGGILPHVNLQCGLLHAIYVNKIFIIHIFSADIIYLFCLF